MFFVLLQHATVFWTLAGKEVNRFCLSTMYEQISEHTLYLMFYASVAVLNLTACLYLLLRRANAIAPDVTSPLRLRRWTAGFLGAAALSHLWYLPLLYLTSGEDIKMLYFVCALFDFLTVFPLAIVVLFTMLQDRRRPLWPVAVMMAPLVAGMAVCVALRSDALLPTLYAYYVLLVIGIIIYMVRATRQYGRWLRDNYADLEHKEVWQSLLILATILLGFSFYAFERQGLIYKYAAQLNVMVLTGFLLWRVETLSDLSLLQQQSSAAELDAIAESETGKGAHSQPVHDKIEHLLQKYCIDTKLYLQHDLTITQLSKAIGTNRLYLSQYLSRLGVNYNAYINNLRINYFIDLYHEAVAAHRPFTAKSLAYESGYRNYTTFSAAFKQLKGQTVSAWMRHTTP